MARGDIYYKGKTYDTGCLFPILFFGGGFYLILIKAFPFSTISITLFIIFFKTLLYPKLQSNYKNWRFKNSLCPHGIPGGKTIEKCSICLQEKQDIKQKLELQKLKFIEIEKENERLNRLKLSKRDAEIKLIELIRTKNVKKLELLIESNPYEFEGTIAKLYIKLGYKVKQTPKSNDKGKDLIMQKSGKKYLVECKRYSKNNLVSRPELQKFYAACVEENAEIGYFITTSDFTSSAKKYPNDIFNKIVLINGQSLILMMEKAYPDSLQNDQYDVICDQCGEVLKFNLNSNSDQKCRLGHLVQTNIDEVIKGNFETTNYVFLDPKCPICDSRMRRIKSKYNKKDFFGGCTKYPSCKGLVKSDFHIKNLSNYKDELQ